jgi:hypothetical protein
VSGQPPPIALIDRNNFHVSCERVFDPRLEVASISAWPLWQGFANSG